MQDSMPSPPISPVSPSGTVNARGKQPQITKAPRRIGSYELIEELGRGGMGVVHKAWQASLKRFVALKMLRAGIYATSEDLQRFRTEAEAIAQLQHPNLLQVYEIGNDDGVPFLALELVEGGSLASHLNGAPQPIEFSAEFVATLARTIFAVHQRGIIHRDLKPGNILVQGTWPAQPTPPLLSQEETQTLLTGSLEVQPKIADFGLAKRLDDAGITGTVIVGTPSYMAPEQACTDHGKVGPRTDVYALGAILYEMLTGRPPFRAETALETVRHVLEEEPVPPSQLRPRLPRDLETICLKCLAKDPAKRFETSQALANDLQHFLLGEPILARPTPWWERVWKFARRRPAVTILSLSLTVCFMVSFALVSWLWHDASEARDDARDQAKKELDARLTAEKARNLAEMREAQAALDEGLLLCEQGDVRRGLLWLARSLELAEKAGQANLARAVRINIAEWQTQLWRPSGRMFPHAEVVKKHDVPEPGVIRCTAVSPNGQYLATAGDYGAIVLWDIATGKPLHAPMLHMHVETFLKTRISYELVFSPDSKKLLAGLGNGRASLWSVETGKELPQQFVHDPHENVWSGAFHPGAEEIATGCEDGHVRRWDLKHGKLLGKPLLCGESPVYAVRYSKDGKWLVGTTRQGDIKVWDTSSNDCPLIHAMITMDQIFSLAIDPGKRWLLVGGEMTSRLWDLHWQSIVEPAMPQTARVGVSEFSRDGELCLTASGDGKIRLWRTATRQQIGETFRSPVAFRQASLIPGTQSIVVGGADGKAHLWQAPALKSIGTPLYHPTSVMETVFSSDGHRLWSVANAGLSCYDLQKDVLVLDIWRPGDPPKRAALRCGVVHPREQAAAAHFWRVGECLVADPTGKKVLHRFMSGPTDMHHLAFSRDGRTLVGLGTHADNSCRVLLFHDWDQEKSVQHTVEGIPDHVRRACFDPQGNTIAFGCTDRKVRFFDVRTKKWIGHTITASDSVVAVSYSLDGKLFATGCRLGTVQIWDVESWQQASPLIMHREPINSLRFSADNLTILSASVDHTACFWDVKTGIKLGPPLRHGNVANHADFDPEGKTVATASADRTVLRWQVPAPPRQGSPDEVRAWVQSITGMRLDEAGGIHFVTAEPGL